MYIDTDKIRGLKGKEGVLDNNVITDFTELDCMALLNKVFSKVLVPLSILEDETTGESLDKLEELEYKSAMVENEQSFALFSIGLGVKGDFHPKKQIHYRQVKGKGEVRYDDILKAKNDEVVLNPDQLKMVVKKYFTN